MFAECVKKWIWVRFWSPGAKPSNGIDSVFFLSINDLNTKCHTSFLSSPLIRASGKMCTAGLGPIWGNTIKIGREWYAEHSAPCRPCGGWPELVFGARSGWVWVCRDRAGCRVEECEREEFIRIRNGWERVRENKRRRNGEKNYSVRSLHKAHLLRDVWGLLYNFSCISSGHNGVVI